MKETDAKKPISLHKYAAATIKGEICWPDTSNLPHRNENFAGAVFNVSDSFLSRQLNDRLNRILSVQFLQEVLDF